MQGAEASAAPAQGNAVLEKLALMELARKADRDKKREEEAAKADPKESIKGFLTTFNEQQQLVAATVSALQQAGPVEDGPASRELQAKLDALLADVFQMERQAADASYYLPTYDQKQCSLTVGELRTSIEAARAALIPRKKFAFKSKVSRLKGAEVSTAAAAAAPATDAAPVSAGGTSGSGGQAAQGQHAAASSSSCGAVEGAAGSAAAPAGTDYAAAAVAAAAAASPSERDIALVKAGRGLMGLRNQVVVLSPSQVGSRDYVLVDLEGCEVYLAGHMPALRMLGLRNTRVVSGPVTGACFVDGAVGCTLVLAAYQVRIHRCCHTDFYLRVRSKPIIEHTTAVRFAPFCLDLEPAAEPGSTGSGASSSSTAPDNTTASRSSTANAAATHTSSSSTSRSRSWDAELRELLQRHKLGEESGMFSQVDDFGWIKAVQSPNWSVLPGAERKLLIRVPWQHVSESSAPAQPQGEEQGSAQASGQNPALDDCDEI